MEEEFFISRYNMILNKMGTVTKDNRVVTDTRMAAYSLSLSYFSANMDVIVEAGMAVIIITVLIDFEESTRIREVKYITIGIRINFVNTP